jgi:hypothetical protein
MPSSINGKQFQRTQTQSPFVVPCVSCSFEPHIDRSKPPIAASVLSTGVPLVLSCGSFAGTGLDLAASLLSQGMALPVEPKKNNVLHNIEKTNVLSSSSSSSSFPLVPKVERQRLLLAFLGNPILPSTSTEHHSNPSDGFNIPVELRFDYLQGHSMQLPDNAWVTVTSKCQNVTNAERLIVVDDKGQIKFFRSVPSPFHGVF